MTLILKIYHKCATWKIVQLLVAIYRHGTIIGNGLAYLRLKKMLAVQKNQVKEKINVVFLVQNIQIWGKYKPIYEKMITDASFHVCILAVPDHLDMQNPDKVFDYFSNIGYHNVIDARCKDGWFNMKDLNPNYVFFPRPYDQYLPKQYRSYEVAEYAKTCYIPYGSLLTKTVEGSCFNKLFLRNIYMFFADSNYYKEKNIKRMKYSHEKKVRKSFSIGYPSFEDYVRITPNREKDNITILWTPRWSDSGEVGGSNFIPFMNPIVEFVDQTINCNLIFRPHPLLFKNFVDTGKVSEESMNEYINKYETKKRMKIDKEAEYVETFKEADVMLTDITSLIPEFFLTKKPIIYCESGAILNEFMKNLLRGCYVVNSWDEAQNKLKMILDGIDPMKQTREEICELAFGTDVENASENICNEILRDFYDR